MALSWARVAAAALLAAALGACSGTGSVPFFPAAETPREQYLQGLEQAGLGGTALALDWSAAADSALREAVEVTAPYGEEGFLEPGVPTALGYRVVLSRGQKLRVEAELDTPDSTDLFVEVFLGDSVRGPERVLAPEPGSDAVEYEPRRGGEVFVRIQPELLRGGRYRLSLVVTGALAFPVEGRDTDAILSFFGDDREAGRRVHHGVDVFAPRGTPVLAVTEGTVTRVGDQNLGGLVVWVRDEERGINQYYAHLDRQLVAPGDRVQPGDTVGLVGNTGNARTTPPHLHFGLYQRGEGPVDPWPFLFQPGSDVPPVTLAAEQLSGWVVVRDGGVRIRRTPGTRSTILDEVAAGTPLRVMAGTGEWLRIRLPDGQEGFILGRLTERAENPLRTATAGRTESLTSYPVTGSSVVGAVDSGDGLEVLAQYGGFVLVRGGDGRDGWMSAEGVDS